MPLLLAAGMTLGPVPAGLLGFFGAWDKRWLRGEVTWARSFFNRSQIALCSLLAAMTFRALGGGVDQWPAVIGPCIAAVAVDVTVNIALVAAVAMLAHYKSFIEIARGVVLDNPLLFVATYVGLVPLALLMATAARFFGVAGLAAGVVPVLMARQVFALLKRSAMANREAQARLALIKQLNHRIESERRDERARLAMDLHDGALATLFRVHLMGEVVRQDLVSGRLLELETDVPELNDATREATDTLRGVIRRLRNSSVGAQGVCKTLDLLVEELSTHARALFHTDVMPVGATPSVQLVTYQVAREALENAVRHSGAQNIFLSLRQEGRWIRLIVRDDGSGFNPADVDSEAHFGLAIMKQRATQAGGVLYVASEPGWGTQVVARLPVAEDQVDRIDS